MAAAAVAWQRKERNEEVSWPPPKEGVKRAFGGEVLAVSGATAGGVRWFWSSDPDRSCLRTGGIGEQTVKISRTRIATGKTHNMVNNKARIGSDADEPD